jgi:hypothetical protein
VKALKHAYAREMGGIAMALSHANARGRVNFTGLKIYHNINSNINVQYLQLNAQTSFTLS